MKRLLPILIISLTTIFAACQKTFETDIELGIDSRDITLKTAAGKTNIMVYSTGKWNVAFDTPTDWIELQHPSGDGNGYFAISYQENAGIARSAKLLISKGDKQDSIEVVQEAGESDPTLVFDKSNVILMRDGATVTLDLITNLLHNLPQIESTVTYTDTDDSDWIGNIEISLSQLKFTVATNTSQQERYAVVKLHITDALGDTISTSATVYQNSESPYLELSSAQTAYTVSPFGETLTVGLNTNLSSYYSVQSITSYDSTSTGWLENWTIDEQGLKLTVAANKDAQRAGSFVLRYTSIDGVEYSTAPISIMQDKSAELISFEQLRTKATSTTIITDKVYIEGYVVSDCSSMNMALNPNTTYKSVDVTQNERTAYIQNADGTLGFKVVFAQGQTNTLARYDKVALSVYNRTVIREEQPLCFTIDQVQQTDIISASAGTAADIPTKSKSLAQLTDQDLYTYVSVPDMEFVFKDGSYMNVYETYVLKSSFNTYGNNRCDGWATLLTDKNGDRCYMLINSLCPWRRSGNGVPKGVGDMRGILTHESLIRYGDNLGRYSIRPIDEADIAIPATDTSAFTTLTEWNWNDGTASLNFETAGTVATATGGDRILADIGTGFFSTNTGGKFAYSADYNSLVTSTKGLASACGIVSTTPANTWWDWDNNRGNAFVVELPTTGISGSNLYLSFALAAGSISAATSYDFPMYWQVEYSVDDTAFTTATDSQFVLKTLPWWDATVGGTAYTTSMEAGLGHTEHLVKLPAELFGKANVTLRITPRDKTIATLDMLNLPTKTLTQTLTTSVNIRFGAISVKYK